MIKFMIDDGQVERIAAGPGVSRIVLTEKGWEMLA